MLQAPSLILQSNCVAGASLQRPNDGSANSAGSASNKYIRPITVIAPVMIKTTTVTWTENPVSAMLTARLQLGKATGGVISESDRCRLGFGGNAVFLGAGNYGESLSSTVLPNPRLHHPPIFPSTIGTAVATFSLPGLRVSPARQKCRRRCVQSTQSTLKSTRFTDAHK